MHTCPTSSPVLWAGADLAKTSFVSALWGHQEIRDQSTRAFPRTRAGASELLAWLRKSAPQDAHLALVLEATATFAEELATWLQALDPELPIAIVNPVQTHAFTESLGLRNKTDDLDARSLARYGHERRPAAWEASEAVLRVLRDLTRTRLDLVQARTAMTLRLKDHERSSPAATRALEAVIAELTAQIKALENEMRAHVEADVALASRVRRLASIQGVGFLTAVSVLAELGDLRRFMRSRQLTAFAGLSPRTRESGTSLKGRAHLCKQGSARVRAILYMAASSAARWNPDLAEVYQRLIAAGKLKRVALGAVMRKLLVLMRAVLIADQDWVPKAPPKAPAQPSVA